MPLIGTDRQHKQQMHMRCLNFFPALFLESPSQMTRRRVDREAKRGKNHKFKDASNACIMLHMISDITPVLVKINVVL